MEVIRGAVVVVVRGAVVVVGAAELVVVVTTAAGASFLSSVSTTEPRTANPRTPAPSTHGQVLRFFPLLAGSAAAESPKTWVGVSLPLDLI